MVVGAMRLEFYAPWAHSLKDKRMEVQSLKTRIRGKFQVSCAEVENQDLYQSIVLGVAVVAGDTRQVERVLDQVEEFAWQATQAQLVSAQRQLW